MIKVLIIIGILFFCFIIWILCAAAAMSDKELEDFNWEKDDNEKHNK